MKGQLEKKKTSRGLQRSTWIQYTFILNKDSMRYINEGTQEVSELNIASEWINYSIRVQRLKNFDVLIS